MIQNVYICEWKSSEMRLKQLGLRLLDTNYNGQLYVETCHQMANLSVIAAVIMSPCKETRKSLISHFFSGSSK